MLEYTIDEAKSLLAKNLESAKQSSKQTELDLDFLKDQMTTTEVNIARVYNWDVLRRQRLMRANADKSSSNVDV